MSPGVWMGQSSGSCSGCKSEQLTTWLVAWPMAQSSLTFVNWPSRPLKPQEQDAACCAVALYVEQSLPFWSEDFYFRLRKRTGMNKREQGVCYSVTGCSSWDQSGCWNPLMENFQNVKQWNKENKAPQSSWLYTPPYPFSSPLQTASSMSRDGMWEPKASVAVGAWVGRKASRKPRSGPERNS